MGLDEAIAAGAVICGAYFGDKMTPLSETTILVPKLVGGGLTVGEHVRNMFWTAGPALGISLVIFLVLGLNADPEAEISTDAARDALAVAFNIGFVNLLPLLLLVVFSILRYPPFLSILGSALFAGILAPFTQWEAVKAFVDDPSLGPVATSIEAIFSAMATGFVSNSGVEPIDALFTRGGMASLLTTIWLVLGALSFAAVMEHAGFLQRLLLPIVSRTRRRGSLILAVNSSGVGLNVIAGDQYVADVLPATHVPRRVLQARAGSSGAVPGRRGLGDGDVGAGALEHLRRLHLRSARRLHRRLLPVLLLQPAQPLAGRPVRVPRLQGPEGSRPLGRRRTCRAQPHQRPATRRRGDPHERPDHDGRSPRSRRGFTLPSAYTILFALIVAMAIATWIIPAGALRPRQGGGADPRDLPRGRW